MPSPRIPKLRWHKTHGPGIVALNGHDCYLGKWPGNCRKPPPEVQAEYDRPTNECLANGRCFSRGSTATGDLTVNDLILAFWARGSDNGDGSILPREERLLYLARQAGRTEDLRQRACPVSVFGSE